MRPIPTPHIINVALLLLILSCLLGVKAHAEDQDPDFILVINTQDKELTLSKQQIRHIFMGGSLSNKFKAVNLPSGNQLRIEFNTKIVGLTESRIQAYWAQMKFTGRSKPPMELETPQKALEYLVKTESAITYLPSDIEIPDGLTIIYP
ncbi:hypothetical protein Q4574_17340 [Aliiglaciecola sp. 3_MG-2023]|uniref:hypothetical protein n=1 Tax=Aliiglaciecola sp. 3_MG-2023 TaxID=3062644 RepID=UPI0026E16191|nr:hypothetical protein [Aliiglaciecola sp. 3_MG-2023]MDO6695066.1 hypothetical protein [Aliiglaciecola sp. 3_MG-2023]